MRANLRKEKWESNIFRVLSDEMVINYDKTT